MRWIPFAMVRIAAFFIAGALLGIFSPEILMQHTAIVLFTCFSLSYFPVKFLLRNSLWIKNVSGFIGLTSVLLAGYLNVHLRKQSLWSDHLLHETSIDRYQIKLITPAEEKAKSWKRVGEVLSVHTSTGWKSSRGRINLYWPKEEQVTAMDYGDILLVNGPPREIEPAYNPHEFDLKRHNSFKNIYHQQYIRTGGWALVKASTDRGFLFYAHRARAAAVKAFQELITSKQEQGILMALVLGVTDGLDNDILNAYSASGAMHVLAVSGMHVSIIYGILLFFSKPFRKGATAEWIVAITSLVLLWLYAFITGLSPSVLRAVAMFSFVVIAKPLGRTTNIYNTLAASAFCLLLYDPYLIMSVGFQLSYLAVLGIVYLQRPIYNLWEAPTSFLNWAWQITTVSIAAQLSTLALSIYFFHQFPVYFLAANLFIIPASCIVLVAGIFLLLLSPVPLISVWLGIGLEWFVHMMNKGIFLMEDLPFSVIDHLSITIFQCYLLFFMILAAVLLFQFRKFKTLIFVTAFALLFSAASWQHFYEANKKRFTVYRIPGHRAIEWGHNGHSYFIADSTLLYDMQKLKFHIQPNRIANHVHTVSSATNLSASSVRGLFLFHTAGKTFLSIQAKDFQLPAHLTVDYLIVSNNSLSSLKRLASHIQFQQLILDSSNTYRYNQRIEREAAIVNTPCFSVLRKGAFVVDL